jgi:hypothetical protein
VDPGSQRKKEDKEEGPACGRIRPGGKVGPHAEGEEERRRKRRSWAGPQGENGKRKKKKKGGPAQLGKEREKEMLFKCISNLNSNGRQSINNAKGHEMHKTCSSLYLFLCFINT